MSSGALDVLQTRPGRGTGRRRPATLRGEMEAAWKTYRKRRCAELIEPRMNKALAVLARPSGPAQMAETRNGGDPGRSIELDLQLPYRSQAEVDPARMDL